jgi:AcrR family transcriptional regulator
MEMREPRERMSQDRRKAATRARIALAASRLFAEKGYAATSMDDIADAAGIAPRTIYLHFDSKAAVVLAYLDEWVAAFTDAVIARPVREPIGEVVSAALRELRNAGWPESTLPGSSKPHPMLDSLVSGPSEIAGHILQTWVVAQGRIVADTAERGGFPGGSLEPRARAAAVFSSWLATILVFRDRHEGGDLPNDVSDHEVGARIARLMSDGSL